MFKNVKNIFAVGIGGIGISALARILHSQGYNISGSDLVGSELTEELEAQGIKVMIGHRKENLPKHTDLVIYSVAVPLQNPERIKAKRLNIKELSYPEAAGEWAENKKVIAVAGTNGKTTTAAMIATVLEQAGLDPSAIIGSKVLAWDSNARLGQGKYLVLEADEYRRAFINYSPFIAVITNIEVDHLDYFKNLDDIKKAFAEFTNKIKPNGVLVYNPNDKNSSSVVSNFSGKKTGSELYGSKLAIPGEFNQANAGAAAAACKVLGIPNEIIAKTLENFKGTWRRFEKVGKFGKAEIISDYAHHPTAVKLTLDTVKEVYPGKRILAVFQPHQHNRTKKLFKEFVKSLCSSSLNDFIIAEIFDVAGRGGQADQDISSQDLVREIQKCGKKVIYAKDLTDCEQKVKSIASSYDIIIFMGAGDIYKVANDLINQQYII